MYQPKIWICKEEPASGIHAPLPKPVIFQFGVGCVEFNLL